MVLLNLIYVDDNPDDSYVVGKCLQKIALNITFNWLTDGKELLNYLQKKGSYENRKNIKAQNFILLDINMPGLNGFEALSKIKEDFKGDILKVPIIMFSSSDRDEDKEKSRTLGASGYLVKPNSYPEICFALEDLFIKWGDLHKTPITEI